MKGKVSENRTGVKTNDQDGFRLWFSLYSFGFRSGQRGQKQSVRLQDITGQQNGRQKQQHTLRGDQNPQLQARVQKRRCNIRERGGERWRQRGAHGSCPRSVHHPRPLPKANKTYQKYPFCHQQPFPGGSSVKAQEIVAAGRMTKDNAIAL